jgi:glutamate-5-semialdehyde dehydrogenase
MADGQETHIDNIMEDMGRIATQSAQVLAMAPTAQKNQALNAAADALRSNTQDILHANAKDMAAGREKGLTPAMLDRLELTVQRIEAIAAGLEDIATLDDPVGDILAEVLRPNGLKINRVRVPLGVIGIIYESRPNVTADAGGLCLKSGNAAILRGGSESFYSSRAIMACMVQGLKDAGLPAGCIQMVPVTDRAAVGKMLQMDSYIDVIVPRGGKSLISRITQESRIPLFKHLDGICHVYVDAAADEEKARAVVMNAKMRRTGVCGAAETLLMHRSILDTFGKKIVADLLDAGCAIRGDDTIQTLDNRIIAATTEDWQTEYLDAILAVKCVDSIDDAIAHIGQYGSHHTDSIITEDTAAADHFMNAVDSAIVMRNASTQFADGGEFGMGAEIGISTGKLHARGPVGVEQLTTFKYKVYGDGQTRP